MFRFATRAMTGATRQVLAESRLKAEELALVIPHQANARIIESAARALGMPLEKFFVNIERYGNTSAASIPIALTEAIQAGRVKPGDRIVMVGFGAGLTWAAAAIEWGFPVPASRNWLQRLLARIGMFFAGGRSTARRAERSVYNWAMEQVEEDWREENAYTLGVQAWTDAAHESMPKASALFFKQLRTDRVLRPI